MSQDRTSSNSGPTRFGKRLRRADAEQASARVEERLRAEKRAARGGDDAARQEKKKQQALERAARRQASREQRNRERAQASAKHAADRAEKLQERLRARKRADDEKRVEKALSTARRTIARNLATEDKLDKRRIGAPLGELFWWWIEVFSRRPDVEVTCSGQPTRLDDFLLFSEEKFAQKLAFVSRMKHDVVSWESRNNEQQGFSALHGSVCVSDLIRHPESVSQVATQAVERALLAPVADGTLLDPLDALGRRSTSRYTPRSEIVRALVDRGLDEEQATALYRWLGRSCCLLLEEAATNEGRRRQMLFDRAASADQDAPLNDSLIAELNAGPALDRDLVKELLEGHRNFVTAGGAGGSFVPARDRGLPTATYAPKRSPQPGQADPPGQLQLRFENATGIDWTGAELSSANLLGMRCELGKFQKSRLCGAHLRHGYLSGANFQAADLSEADFSGARLAGADFKKARLVSTNFEGADLRGADFSGAIVARVKFGGALMRGVKY